MIRRLFVLIASFAAIMLPAEVLAAGKPAPPQTAVFAGGLLLVHGERHARHPRRAEGRERLHRRPREEPQLSRRDQRDPRATTSRCASPTTPAKLDYGFLLYKYWKLVDPTDDGGQFCGRGPSYRPAVFVTPDPAPDRPRSRAPRPPSA